MYNFYNQETVIGRFMRSRGISLLVVMAFVIATVFAFGVSTATAVSVSENGNTRMVYVHSNNVDNILSTVGIEDGQDYELCKVTDGYILKIGKRINVTVKKQNEVYSFSMISDTVAAALFHQGITYNQCDIIQPSLDTCLTEDTVITIRANSTVKEKVCEAIPFKTVYENSNSLASGKEKVQTAGINGVRECEYSVTYENGVEVSRILLGSAVISQPVAKKILKGTAVSVQNGTTQKSPAKVVRTSDSGITTDANINSRIYSDLTPQTPIELDENGCPVNYRQCITGIASGYSPVDGSWTASGHHVRVGYIAVNPDQIPYGTYMYIKTPDNSSIYGLAMAADTGGFVNMGRTVDLFFASPEEANDWGLRNVEIYIF